MSSSTPPSFELSSSSSNGDSTQSIENSSHWQSLFVAVSGSMNYTVNELNLVRGRLEEKEREIQTLNAVHAVEMERMREEYEGKIRTLEEKVKKYAQYDIAQTKRDFTFDECFDTKSYAFEFLKNCCDQVINDFDSKVNVPIADPEAKELKIKQIRISAAAIAPVSAGFKMEIKW